jgi:hypothetical protein
MKTSKGFCIKAGGTGGVEALTDEYVKADETKHMVYSGEVVWVTNATVKLLGTE